ncbi:MAG: WxcM-like domain-containing protein [Bacteroidales bacterium]
MITPQIVQGGIFTDERGILTHCNELDMTEVERFYVIKHPDKSVIRAWHAHQDERKWFYATKGSFTIAIVKIDDWDNPSPTLQPEIYTLSEGDSRVLCVPKGYANGIKAMEDDSALLVFSGKRMPEALLDSWRYDKNMWVDWSLFE